MSNIIRQTEVSDSKDCPAYTNKIKFQKIITRDAQIGDGLMIRRALPHPERRIIGAWCFFDHFGPFDVKHNGGLDIPPHPHMGLHTFTYLIEGKILHCDSLGSIQHIVPGQVNLMTAGKGIAHSEESVADAPVLQGVQLWLAMPDTTRNEKPKFTHYAEVPVVKEKGVTYRILAGDVLNETAPTQVETNVSALHVHAEEETEILLPLNPEFEYGILILAGSIHVEGFDATSGLLLYSPVGHKNVPIKIKPNTHFIMIGGEPFKEEVLLWWNFVARDKNEMMQALYDWENNTDRFGEVKGYKGGRLNPPGVPN